MKKLLVSTGKYPRIFVDSVFSDIHNQLTKRVANYVGVLMISIAFALFPIEGCVDDSNSSNKNFDTVIYNPYGFNVKDSPPNIEKFRYSLSKASNFNIDRFYQTGNIKFLELVIDENIDNFQITSILKLMEGKFYFDRGKYEKAMLIFKGAHHYNPNSIFLLIDHLISAQAYQRELIFQMAGTTEKTINLIKKVETIQIDIDYLMAKIKIYHLYAKTK